MLFLKEQKVGSLLGICLILLFAIIYLAFSYYAIDNALSKYGPGYEVLYVMR